MVARIAVRAIAIAKLSWKSRKKSWAGVMVSVAMVIRVSA